MCVAINHLLLKYTLIGTCEVIKENEIDHIIIIAYTSTYLFYKVSVTVSVIMTIRLTPNWVIVITVKD